MRVMLRFRFPVDEGNDIIRSGKIQQVFEAILQQLKPEAAYFYPEGGDRAGHFIFDMQSSPQVVQVCEPLWFGLHAKVDLVPVMTADDLQQGFSGLGGILATYDQG